MPGAGVDVHGRWQKPKHSKKFLFPVKAVSKVFRAKYVACLRTDNISDKPLYDRLFSKDWVVYAKRPFGGPKQVIEYLGHYTHKVAISNHRIVQVDSDSVHFQYKDYKNGGNTEIMKLCYTEFVRRFVQHILPFRFVRIRHFGIISSTWKRGKLQALQQSLKVQPMLAASIKTLLRKCPCCKTGTLLTIEVFGKRGPPAKYFTETTTATVSN